MIATMVAGVIVLALIVSQMGRDNPGRHPMI
ncbi:hypothetical protein SEA_ZOOMAN_334 [Microbacterium phage Zooman]|nr:hypothetical protein SEA_ZOOMAN_21 [Microbacterium phage Zooman]UDL16575.1 hypothetical protein SEA_ZOOMAN_334 [Microbacterium phage Zooman]